MAIHWSSSSTVLPSCDSARTAQRVAESMELGPLCRVVSIERVGFADGRH